MCVWTGCEPPRTGSPGRHWEVRRGHRRASSVVDAFGVGSSRRRWRAPSGVRTVVRREAGPVGAPRAWTAPRQAASEPVADDQVGLVYVRSDGDGRVLNVSIGGEVDFCTLDGLRVPLEGLRIDDGVVVCMDLAELRFVDLPALRVLACFARRAQADGHRVRTLGAGSTLAKVARILGVADDLGLP